MTPVLSSMRCRLWRSRGRRSSQVIDLLSVVPAEAAPDVRVPAGAEGWLVIEYRLVDFPNGAVRRWVVHPEQLEVL